VPAATWPRKRYGEQARHSGRRWLYSFTQLSHGFAPLPQAATTWKRIDSGDRVRFWMRKPVDLSLHQNAAASISMRAHYYEPNTRASDGAVRTSS